jgi:class 3 adenylate cyclase
MPVEAVSQYHMMKTRIRYARNKGGQSVAYQVYGDGPLDIVFIPDWCTNLEVMWEEPSTARFLERLSSFGRLVCFDKRGSGISDPVPLGAIPTTEEWMIDVEAVLDSIGSERAVLFGHGDGAPLAIMFAATYPGRTTSLVLLDACARRVRADDYPCGLPPEIAAKFIDRIIATWASGHAAFLGAPSVAGNPGFIEYRARLERLAMSPGEFAALYPPTYETDIRPALSTISVPTLVLHRKGNPYIRIDSGRYLAEHIEGAEFIELSGDDHFFHSGDTETMLGAVQHFLTGTRETPDHDRVLATVLFTDIVGATKHAERLGDKLWHGLIDRHHAVVRQELRRFRGKEIDTAGDGFFATFDGPARGVRCALAIQDMVQALGIDIRAGLHIGECELMGEKVGGIAVHIGARVMGMAGGGETLVSRTVKDLVAGSGLQFEEKGKFNLKGIAGEWELFRAS